MSRSTSSAKTIGKAAGQHPTAAGALICVGLWMLGYWYVAVILIAGAVLATDVEDRAAAWWEEVGLFTRAGVYLAVPLLAYVAVVGVPMWCLYAAGGTAALAVLFVIVRWWRLVPYREHVHTYMEPLHRALAPEFGVKPDEFSSADWLLGVKPGLLDAEDGIMIRLPTGRVPSELQMERALRTVAQKLELRAGDYEVDWRLGGANQHLHIFRAKPKPTVPAHVPWDDEWRSLLERTPADRWLIGRGLGGKPYYLDPTQENPHILFSCTTGWGKSNALGVVLADHLHDGWEALVLDLKYGSLPWAADLPGVTYARSIREIHDALIRVGVESERRRQILADAPWNQRPKFKRLVVFVEETNTFIDELAAFWVEERARLKEEARANGERIDLPTKSPALRVYRQAGFMGRELWINLFVIAQRAEANQVGGSAIRNQLGTKVLGWPEPADWAMHAGRGIEFRQSTGKPGHSFIIRVGKVDEVQWAYAEPADLRAWALSGRPAVSTIGLPASHRNENLSHLGAGGGSFLGGDSPASEPEDPDDRPITLRQAVDEGVIEAPLSSVQRWSRPSMDNGFPLSVGGNTRSGYVYDRNALRSWWSLYRSEVNADD